MIKIYPVSIEAFDDNHQLVFNLSTFDAQSAMLKVDAAITNDNVDEFCTSLKRALILLDLGNDNNEDQCEEKSE